MIRVRIRSLKSVIYHVLHVASFVIHLDPRRCRWSGSRLLHSSIRQYLDRRFSHQDRQRVVNITGFLTDDKLEVDIYDNWSFSAIGQGDTSANTISTISQLSRYARCKFFHPSWSHSFHTFIRSDYDRRFTHQNGQRNVDIPWYLTDDILEVDIHDNWFFSCSKRRWFNPDDQSFITVYELKVSTSIMISLVLYF